MQQIRKLFILTFFLTLFSICCARQHGCTIKISGRITDIDTGLPLSGVTITADPGGFQAISDSHGYFQLVSLCAGSEYRVTATSLGFESASTRLTLTTDSELDIVLHHGTIKLHDVDVVGHGQSVITTNPVKTLSREDIAEARGGSLAEHFDALAGVGTLQTGTTIAKPVINGMHSNRILVLNNGIRQEGQQWGSEHAPEIDPFIAKDFKLIKGAEGVRYGADAIGGVIMVMPPAMPVDPHLSGEIHTLYNTNGRVGAASGMLQSAIERINGLSWRIQGTAKRGGNTRAADYYLGNTGIEEANVSAAIQYSRGTSSLEAYYSRFQTSLGILTSAHIGSLADIEARLDAGRPLEDYPFSYRIAAPRQQVVHDLGKLKWHRDHADGSWLDIQYGIQRNHRQEYDVRRGDRDALPMLDMILTTQTLDASYQSAAKNGWEREFGANVSLQVNNNVPGTLNTPLIPNYDSFSSGVFFIQRLIRDGYELEGGIRYDFKTFDAAGFDNSLEYYGGYRQFHNVSGTLGAVIPMQDVWQLRSNIGLAWRAPSANELYSNGLHHGAALYEIGNPDLESERSLKWIVTPSYTAELFSLSLDVYAQYIDRYIYARPSAGEFMQTIRGTFPVFRYEQTDATFWGIDLTAHYHLPYKLSYQIEASMIRARDVTNDAYLPYIPGDRLDHFIRWEIPVSGKLSASYLKLGHRVVRRQTRYQEGSDYVAPPPAYQLLSAFGGTRLPIGDRFLDVTVSVNNLLNTSYKEYMNRFRYFSHDMGRNIGLKLGYIF